MNATVGLLHKLGFVIQWQSILKPTQKKEFLGYVIDSVDMTVSINSDKSNPIIKIQKYWTNTTPSMGGFAWIIISVISIFPVVPIGKLQHKTLEKEGILLLKKNAGMEKKTKKLKDY